MTIEKQNNLIMTTAGIYSFYNKPYLPVDEIFVFGSNLAGRHGLGAALTAFKSYGAVYGKGVGFQGSSYAIPTKNEKIKTLPIHDVVPYIHEFVEFTKKYDLLFYVTLIGCGLAGYKPEDIAPHFKGAVNCKFHISFMPFLVE